MITVVGLGPGAPDMLTQAAYQTLKDAPAVYLRTRKHPTVSLLEEWGVPLHSYDEFYDREASFEDLYKRIVADVVEKGRAGDVVYAVPGHPLVAESTVQGLLAQRDVPVKVIPGLSGVEATYTLLGVDPIAGLQVVDALQLDQLRLNPALGALVLQLYSRRVASQAKTALMRYYPDEHPVVLVRAASVPGEEHVEHLPLFEIDRRPDVDHLTSLYLPPAEPVGLERLRAIVAKLRAPDGCPWDREQTHQTLTRYVLEEAHEVVEAIDADDDELILEELGDLLLQVFLHAQIAEEREAFDLDEVATGISDKLVRRHPHVFGDVEVSGSEEVLVNWDQLKKAEKAEAGEVESRLGRVPPMPALMYAEKIMGRAAKAGFDWPSWDEAVAKAEEEWAELKQAQASGRPEAVAHELGDYMYALVNLARRVKVDPEEALRHAAGRFTARFHQMEALVEERGLDWDALSLDERKALYQEAKRALDEAL